MELYESIYETNIVTRMKFNELVLADSHLPDITQVGEMIGKACLFVEKGMNEEAIQAMQNIYQGLYMSKNTDLQKEALKLLDNVKDLNDYKDSREIPSEIGTSLLSAHNKFGTISIRE